MENDRSAADVGDLRVLVVEDDPELARTISALLARHESHSVVAKDGRTALAMIEASAEPFHAITCDMGLPDIPGLEVIARARGLAATTGIVAITGVVDVETAVESMKAGADDFLGKPFEAEVLWHMIRKAVDGRAQRVAAEHAALFRKLAYTDALTDRPNRRFIDEFLNDSFKHASAPGQPLVVAYLDIDNFKRLNDYAGHEEGDAILCRIAEVLEDAIQPPAAFGRFGGDEFVAVFPNGKDAAHQAIDQVTARIAEIAIINRAGMAYGVGLSYGIATLEGQDAPRELVAQAEDEMYLNKSNTPALRASERPSGPADIVKITNLKALHNLVRAIDRRDSYTRYHSYHATDFALRVAAELGLDEEQTNALTIGGPIHDLGKIVVPDEILQKPGPLTLEERQHMEEHPVIGAAIAAAVTDYDTVVDLVRHHHEWFDGSGYPAGLRHSEIVLPTRIFNIADAFSAMTTDRPYRRALGAEQAVAEIERGRGRQFDPDLANVFIAVLESDIAERRAA